MNKDEKLIIEAYNKKHEKAKQLNETPVSKRKFPGAFRKDPAVRGGAALGKSLAPSVESSAEQQEMQRSLTVAQLINILKKFPQDLKVGKTGHYGEFHAITKYNIDTNKDFNSLRPKWVTINTPDIGEEPD